MNFVGVPLPPRRHLGRDRLRLQRLHPPRLRDEPRPGAAAPRRRAGGDARAWSRSSATSCKPGDLVFFNTLRRTFSHVGIYIGDDRFVHAPRHGKRRAHRRHELRLLGQALHRRAPRRAAGAPTPAAARRPGRPGRRAEPPARRRPSADRGAGAEAQSAHGRKSHPPRRPPLPRDRCRAIPATLRRADRPARRPRCGRPLHDLRISVTDRCNFRCSYCMPKEVFDKRLRLPAAQRRC